MSDNHKYKMAKSYQNMDKGMPVSMSSCETYGMTWGCDTDCPVLQSGECELQEAENADLYAEALKELS